ncbi:MAG: orotate phosphoribosyltransferase-like protein [Thermoplasmata archaeon]|nr:MAG: orotate phosphoribosyltransferase-like protein [Thermoplasmata archaeon]
MTDMKELIRRAKELKEKGFSEREISEELNLSETTVSGLLSGALTELTSEDVRIVWRSIGVFPRRVKLIAEVMADIIEEELKKRGEEIDSVVGVATNGSIFATFVADILDTELIIYRPTPTGKGGHFASNYANPRRKRVVIIDDIYDTGATLEKAIADLEEFGSKAVLAVVLVNKTPKDFVKGVPLRALIRTVVIRS